MEIKYNYGCSKEEAYERIDSFVDKLSEDYSDMISHPHKEWNSSKDKMNFGFEAKGFNINGNIQLTNKGLVLNGKLPFAARLFSGKIESIINKNLDDLFA